MGEGILHSASDSVEVKQLYSNDFLMYYKPSHMWSAVKTFRSDLVILLRHAIHSILQDGRKQENY